MHALETLRGIRVVAASEALDATQWRDGAIVLRFAPDEAFVIGATEIEVPDEHAIVTRETGLVGTWISRDELRDRVVPHIDWPVPAGPSVLAQGLVAGVPAKLWLDEEAALLLCAAAYGRELAERLG